MTNKNKQGEETQKQVKLIVSSINNRGKILVCGNGGSATMASHFVGELMGKFEHERRPLPAISLFDLATITAIANDYSYDKIFSRQIEALGVMGDILITLSTSGKSKNVLRAIKQAKKQKMEVIEAPIVGVTTATIQENQLVWLHDVARGVEEKFV